MARLNSRVSTTSSANRQTAPRDTPLEEQRSPSSSPAASFSSDKENRGSRPISRGKRRMAPTDLPTARQANDISKRRRLQDRLQAQGSQRRGVDAIEDDEDKQFYDPEQNPEERRKVRHKLRLNVRELHDRADEFLNNDGLELVGLVDRQDHLMSKVKQTADATIDARFMIGVSDLALRRSKRDAQGDNAVTVDIDEWVSKCITFMKYGRPLGSEEAEPLSTQARRNHRRRNESDDEDDNNGDAMEWHVLGTRACFPTNARPAVPTFLLGPLSVQRRVRGPTQRRAAQRRAPLGAAAKPQEINEADLERNENSSLTKQCSTIREQLAELQKTQASAVLAEASDDMDENEAREIFKRHGLSMNFEVPLFNFAVNPRSFGQTVENLFYISFLVKDGYVAVNLDDDGLPTIREIPREDTETQRLDAMKHQQIFSLDFPTYRKLVDAFSITDSMIPHRKNVEVAQVNTRGWYG